MSEETGKEKKARLERELRAMYRSVFSSPAGKRVLYSILSDLGLLAESTNQGEVALRNYAVFLVRDRLGIKDASGLVAMIDTMLVSGK